MILYVCESGKGGGFVNSEKWGGGGWVYILIMEYDL